MPPLSVKCDIVFTRLSSCLAAAIHSSRNFGARNLEAERSIGGVNKSRKCRSRLE